MSSEDATNDFLIILVQGFPHLYDKKDASYKDAKKKENSWMTIAASTNMSVEDCQTRWKSLRDRYCREKKKLDAPSGSGAVNISENSKRLIKSMSFLDTIVQHRKTAGNYSKSSTADPMLDIGDDELMSETAAFLTSISAPQPLSRTFIESEPSPVPRRITPKSSARPAIRVSTPLSSPVVHPSSSSSESTHGILSPVQRFRTISHSESESTCSSIDPFGEELEFDRCNSSLSVREKELDQSKTRKMKRPRMEDVNSALIDALSSLKSMRKTPRVDAATPSLADKLFADSIVAELQRFPPRKRNVIKGEIMHLISRHDDADV